MDLTPKQQLFVDEYLKDRNGGAAAIRCGYAAKSADQHASRMLRMVKISTRVAELIKSSTEDVLFSRERILKELSKGAFVELDVTDWRPADKLKAIEIMVKMLGLNDGSPDDVSDGKSAAKRVLEAIARIESRSGSSEPGDKV